MSTFSKFFLIASALAVLSACRLSTYTAPLVPRFSVSSADPVTVIVYTNAAGQLAKAVGSLKLKDLSGDVGYQIWIQSISLSYYTNGGLNRVAIDPYYFGYDYYDTNVQVFRKNTEVAKDQEISLKLNTPASSTSYSPVIAGGKDALTNAAAVTKLQASYVVSAWSGNGQVAQSGTYNLNSLIFDTSSLQTTFSVVVSNLQP